MSKVLILHPSSSTNLGDHIILAGTKKLLESVIDPIEFVDCDLIRAEQYESYLAEILKDQFDFFVVSGTPWIWDMCDCSTKYQVLENILSVQPKSCKKIAMGIGSCFPFATNAMEVYLYQKDKKGNYDKTRENTRIKIYELFSQFDLIVTRDRFAFHILRSLDIPAVDSICPAAFAPDFHPTPVIEGARPLLVFTDPQTCISHESCDQLWITDYIQFQKWFKETFDPEIVTGDPLARDWCVGQGWDVTWLRETVKMEEYIAKSSFVVSGKVHAAIPAAVLGRQAYILPLDTRYLAAIRLGAIPIIPSSDMDWWMWENVFRSTQWNPHTTAVIESNRNFLIDKIGKMGDA